ncbi:MAG: hypothetical protein MJZ28_12520 [Paludibacteraceae bacterium]|nr:hypothetical protein [Paludibacteraceae bacterium]
MEEIVFNAHNKQENPQNHTTEHLLNQTMIRLFNCGRAVSAHIETKKSKCDYALPQEPTAEEIANIENKMNEVIAQGLPVYSDYIKKEEAKAIYNLSKLPDDASDTLKIVHIGDYDACPCIGIHVENTSEIGTFKILSSSYENGIWRVRWKTVR